MEQITNAFLQYLEEEKSNTLKEADKLYQDERGDEGKFLKVRANMYDIFKALYNAAKGQAKGNIEVCREQFFAKADLISQNWRKSLELAKQHDETEKIVTEEMKLKTAEEIMQKLQALTDNK